MRKLNRSKKRELKRTGKAGVYCRYCKTYHEASIRRGNKDQAHERLCRTKYVSADSKACGQFTPAKSFWCEKNQYWVDVNVCVFRRDNQNLYLSYADCKACKQAIDVDVAINANRPNRILKRRGTT